MMGGYAMTETESLTSVATCRRVLADAVWHLQELEAAWPDGDYLDDPRPYAWRDIIATADDLLEQQEEPRTRGDIVEMVDTLADVLAALDEASPPDPNHPSRQTHDRIVDWMTRVATRAGYPTTPAPAAEDT